MIYLGFIIIFILVFLLKKNLESDFVENKKNKFTDKKIINVSPIKKKKCNTINNGDSELEILEEYKK